MAEAPERFGERPQLITDTIDDLRLLAACHNCNLTLLRELLASGANAGCIGPDFRTPLHIAAENGWLEGVEALYEHDENIDLNARDRWGATPLQVALRGHNFDVGHYLRDRGARTTHVAALRQSRTPISRSRSFGTLEFDGPLSGREGFQPKRSIQAGLASLTDRGKRLIGLTHRPFRRGSMSSAGTRGDSPSRGHGYSPNTSLDDLVASATHAYLTTSPTAPAPAALPLPLRARRGPRDIAAAQTGIPLSFEPSSAATAGLAPFARGRPATCGGEDAEVEVDGQGVDAVDAHSDASEARDGARRAAPHGLHGETAGSVTLEVPSGWSSHPRHTTSDHRADAESPGGDSSPTRVDQHTPTSRASPPRGGGRAADTEVVTPRGDATSVGGRGATATPLGAARRSTPPPQMDDGVSVDRALDGKAVPPPTAVVGDVIAATGGALCDAERDGEGDGEATVGKAEQNSLGVDDLIDRSLLRRAIIALSLPFAYLLLSQGTLWLAVYIATTGLYITLILAILVVQVAVTPPWYRPTPASDRLTDEALPAYWAGIVTDPKSDLGLDYEDISFQSQGGRATLRGWWVPLRPHSRRRTALVFVHGGGRDRRAWLRHVRLFKGEFLGALLFDLSEHGISDGKGRGMGFGVREKHDVLAACKYVRETFAASHIVVLGTSLGGASVLMAAADSAQQKLDLIDVVVAENPFVRSTTLLRFHLFQLLKPYVDFKTKYTQLVFGIFAALVAVITRIRIGAFFRSGIEAIDVADRVTQPTLLMHGTGDEVVPWEHSRDLYEACGSARKELWLAENTAHCMLYDTFPLEFQTRVVGFIEDALHAVLVAKHGSAAAAAAAAGAAAAAPFGSVCAADSGLPSGACPGSSYDNLGSSALALSAVGLPRAVGPDAPTPQRCMGGRGGVVTPTKGPSLSRAESTSPPSRRGAGGVSDPEGGRVNRIGGRAGSIPAIDARMVDVMESPDDGVDVAATDTARALRRRARAIQRGSGAPETLSCAPTISVGGSFADFVVPEAEE